MKAKLNISGKKIQLLYVLWVLENYSDENHTLKQDDIVEILKDKGYPTERKSVARDLKLLFDIGYNIHGIEPELDKDGNELPLKRGKIWLEKNFSDEFDRYWEYKKAIDILDKSLSRLEKQQSKLHGKELIESLINEDQRRKLAGE